MLRLAVARSSRSLEQGLRAGARRQWQPQRIAWQLKNRAFADQNVVAGVPTGPIGSQTPTPPPSKGTSTLPPTGSGTASTGPASIPPPKPPRRRFRRFLLSLIIISALGYAGSVYYSLVNDNFHDFFTEYIPFAEDAVAYFEEREFRRRFPNRGEEGRKWGMKSGEQKVTIGRSSGLSPRVAEGEKNSGADLGQKGRFMSAVEDNKTPPAEKDGKQVTQSQAKGRDEEKERATKKVEASKDRAEVKKTPAQQQESDKATKEKQQQAKQVTKAEPKPAAKESPAPETAAPPPVKTIDHINVPREGEHVTQEVIKILNNIITAVNSSPESTSMFNSTISTAKEDLNNVISTITNLKREGDHEAATKINSAHSDFDQAAKELVRRLEGEMKEQEMKWRDEYEAERERLSQSYQQKLSAEVDSARKVEEQKGQNALLEQEIALQKKFMSDVQASVEAERDGRLSKLDELSSSVGELEKLTGEWNGVVDATIQTQHLQVTLEALRARIHNADHPTPFLNELVALKEVSKDNPTVISAIASLNPKAYTNGIPSPAHLIDRFRRVASEVRKASLLPEDAGVASHAASAVLSRFMFTKKHDRGLPPGEDVEATLSRTEVLLEEGDLDAAAREMNGLQGWAGVLSRDWVGEVRRVLEVRQAVEVIATEARLQSLLVD